MSLERVSSGDREPKPRADSAWVVPGGAQEGLASYVEAVRAGRWIIIAALGVCVAFAAIYLSQAEKVYKAHSDLLVQAVDANSTSVQVPGIIYQSNDPTRTVETVSRLVGSPEVARRVQAQLKIKGTPSDVLGKVSITPLAQADIVTIDGSGPTPQAAKNIADAFAKQFVDYRNEQLRATLAPRIKELQTQVGTDPPTSTDQTDPTSSYNQLRQLQSYNSTGDPSVSFETPAELPTSQASPRPMLTLAAAIIGGGVLGLVGAFGLQILDPRLRREEQLRLQFRLPILARIPLERRRKARPLLPSELSLGALDGYQALRAALTTSRRDAIAGRVLLVTGPSPGDGKTTAAINLASTIAAAGKRVILVEADSRRPSIGKALDLTADVGLASVVTGRRYLVDALIPVGAEDSKLRVLLNSADEAPAADVLSQLSADTLLLQAQRLADWVIVDSPPLNHVAETLALAQAVDDVIVVVRIGRTNSRDLMELAEMLAQSNIQPAGFVVLGGHARQGYY
ncbi:MAG: tyrosine-protein kinase [Solirubrobacteraceae bacterium]|jgi:Mrp family chromosome partitioning ATPase|nr:tyrosine-protein kinase [Solirubrobacteraceae bacterium]